MKFLKIVDGAAFLITVAAGAVAAVAGGFGWTITAVVAGCVACIAPIVNRVASARQQKALLRQLGPRGLSEEQRQRLVTSLRTGPPFDVWVAHNRMEAEPAQFHKQMIEALQEAGLSTQWFGGMNNNTIGIEISGNPSPEKDRFMTAFSAANIPFVDINFADDDGKKFGKVGVWIGVHPGVSGH